MVLAVHNGGDPDQVGAAARALGLTCSVAADVHGEVHRAYGVTLRPTAVVVAPDGTVRAVTAGARSTAAWRAELRRLGVL